MRRFFVKEHGGYRVRRELREMVLFATHDLLKDPPFSRIDLVSCRNLLIYLTRDAQARALDIFHFVLKPRGLLFLGSAESVEGSGTLFHPIDKKHRLYGPQPVARGGLPGLKDPVTILPLKAATEQPKYAEPVLHGRAFLQHSFSSQAFRYDASPRETHGSPADLHFKLIERYAPPSLVVNAHHEIVHLSEQAGRFMQVASGEPTTNLLRMVHPMLRLELRAALLRVAEIGAPVEVSGVRAEIEGVSSTVDLRVAPALDLAPGYMLVTFDRHRLSRTETINTTDESSAQMSVVRQIELELERVKRDLRDTVEQYEASTEEQKATNEELQAMNEELRSGAEELETSREELQSLNEELSTVNVELRSRVEELGNTNSVLQNLMAATQIATVFLDRSLLITRYTPQAVELFRLIPTDAGRPLSDLKHRLDYPQLDLDAEHVLRTLVPIEREVHSSDDGRWFLARLQPYRTTEDNIAGVVLTFVDITERRRAQLELKLELAAMSRLRELSERLLSTTDLHAALGEVLDTAIALHSADFGTVQVYDPAINGLYYGATRGFDEAALVAAPPVDRNFHSTCAVALRGGEPVIASDIPGDPRFADHRSTAASLNYSAAFSFPLKTRRGELQGVLTVHFREPHKPAERELQWAALYAPLGAHLIERQRTEEALRLSEEKFRTLFNSMDEAYAVVEVLTDEQGRWNDFLFLDANPAFMEHTTMPYPVGKKATELLGTPNPRWAQVYGKVLETGEPVRVEEPEATLGRVFDLNIFRLGGPGSRQVAVLFTNIIARKQAEAERERLLQEAELARTEADLERRRLLAVLEQLPVGVHTAEAPSGRLVFDNAAVREICGKAPVAIEAPDYSLHYAGYFPEGHPRAGEPLASHEWPLARTLATGAATAEEPVEIRRADGTRRLASISAVPVRDAEGRVVGAVATSVDVTEREHAEKALRANEEQFRRAIEDAPIPVIMHAEDEQVLQVSRTLTELTGYTREDLPTFAAWLELAYGPGADKVRQHVQELFEGQLRTMETDTEVITRSGEKRCWAFSASAPGTLRDGRRYLVGMALDVTERKEVEAELRANEARLAAIFSEAAVGLSEISLEGRFLHANDELCRILGRSREEVLKLSIAEVTHPDDIAPSLEVVGRTIRTGERASLEKRYLRPEGTSVWAISTASRLVDEEGNPSSLLVATADLTARRLAEEALRESEERLRLIVENARDYAIFSLDLDRCITSWNTGADAILGYNAKEVIGESGDMIFTPEDYDRGVPAKEAAKALSQGRASDERWHVRKDGSRFWASGMLMSMHDTRGDAVGFVKIFRDQTNELEAKLALERSREELLQALQETERARAEAEAATQAKDHFLAVLSHELRTPLTPVLMAVRTLGRDQRMPEKALAALEMIERNIRLEAQFVDDLLDVTRITRGKLELVCEPMHIHEAVTRAVEISQSDIDAKGQQLTVTLSAKHDMLHGDSKRLQQVFWNLLKNASKFAPEGGQIALRSRDEQGRIILEVQDNGIGFEPDAGERIFAAFEQASQQVTREFGGLGLGLAISRATVEAHGGTIRAVSPGAGHGATFIVELPLLGT